jgi:lysophospholipase L1-like esterase
LEQRVLPLRRALFVLALAGACAGPAPARPASTAHDSGDSEGAGAADEAANSDGSSGESVAAQKSSQTAPDTGRSGADTSETSFPSDALPRGTLVLHVGDSFAGALGVPLGRRLKAAGLRSVLEFRTSSYVPTWASGTELPGFVARYKPDLVIVTLGANEFDLQNPETRAPSVRRLVRDLGGRPCVWVSPPRWKQDSGILAVIRDNVKPCRFLDSDALVHDLERKRDGIHPSDAAREVWADAVLGWLVRERRRGADRPWELREEQP